MITINNGQVRKHEQCQISSACQGHLPILMQERLDLGPATWTEDRQRALIEALLLGRPIAPIYLATEQPKRGSVLRFNVIAGAESLHAIRKFWLGELTIAIDADGVPRDTTYRDLQADYPVLADNFKMATLTIVKYYEYSLERQAELAAELNVMEGLLTE